MKKILMEKETVNIMLNEVLKNRKLPILTKEEFNKVMELPISDIYTDWNEEKNLWEVEVMIRIMDETGMNSIAFPDFQVRTDEEEEELRMNQKLEDMRPQMEMTSEEMNGTEMLFQGEVTPEMNKEIWMREYEEPLYYQMRKKGTVKTYIMERGFYYREEVLKMRKEVVDREWVQKKAQLRATKMPGDYSTNIDLINGQINMMILERESEMMNEIIFQKSEPQKELM